MPQESRVKKTLLNARVNLIFYFLTLALSFFSRKIFLNCLGADFIGLTGTLQNLLGFLNLAELGIGSAIGYVLYKPLFDHDQQKINEIISVMGYLYRWIGLIILGGGCLLACFLPLIFPNTEFDLSLIYFAYFSFLASSLIGYFINYRQNLLGADQRNYVVTAYFQTSNIAKTLIQMASAYYTGSYYLWVALELTFGIIYSFILNWKINQTYPWLKADIHLGKNVFKKYPDVMRYIKQLFFHQITAFVQFQTTPFLIYAFVSLKIVAYYGNYTLIVDKLSILMNTMLSSIGASVGNLIAEGNKKKIMEIFYEYATIRFFCASTIAFILYILLEPLISIWLDDEYILSKSILYLVILKIYIQIISGCTGPFLYGYGLFSDIWASVAQSLIFLAFAIIGGLFWGLHGIIIAAIASCFIIMTCWKPYFLFRRGFKTSIMDFILYWCKVNLLNFVNFLLMVRLSGIMLLDKADYRMFYIFKLLMIVICFVMMNLVLYFVVTASTKRIIQRLLSTIQKRRYYEN